MKAEDVRIGNYVLSTLTQSPVKIDWIGIKHLVDGNKQSVYDERNVYDPIQLTEQWLINFGFEKTDQGDPDDEDTIWYKNFNLHQSYDGKTFNFATYVRGSGSFKSGYGIHYVHQLQNLYHGITGQQLELIEQSVY